MWNLNRNKVKIYKADFVRLEDILDSKGYKTGQKRSIYTEPTELWTHVTPTRGMRETWQFGDNLDYDKMLFDTDLPLTETSVLWVDDTDIYDNEGNYNGKLHDYKVRRIGKSLNQVLVAIERVNQSGNSKA